MKKFFQSCLVFTAALLILLTIIIGYEIYDDEYSSEAIRRKMNMANAKKLELGMDSVQVLKIMGPPQYRHTFNPRTNTMIDYRIIYSYDCPEGRSIACQIQFDSHGKLIYISPEIINYPDSDL